MTAKQKYWVTRAQFATVLLIGCIAMWVLVQQGAETAGYVVGGVSVVLSALVFVLVDLKAARARDTHK